MYDLQSKTIGKRLGISLLAIIFSVALDSSLLLAQYSLLDTSKPYIGISQRKVNEEEAKKAGLEKAEGVIVLIVAPETPLFKAGVRKGDILTKIGDTRIRENADLKKLLSDDLRLGSTTTLEVIQDGKPVSMKLELFPTSIAERVKGIEFLADNGNHEAQLYLSRIYWNGHEGIPVDRDHSVTWLQRAAEEGSAVAQAQMGAQYQFGVHLKRDLEKAVSWYRKSADAGLSSGLIGIGTIYYDVLPESEKKLAEAAELFKQAAQQDNPMGWIHMGRMYWSGDYLKQNDEKAVGCFQKALELADSADGHIYMAMANENGRGVVRNYPKALMHYQKAADKGNTRGQFAVGFFYLNGYAVKKDLKTAADWFAKAAENGHPMAQNNIGMMHFHGNGVPKDLPKAKKWLDSAAKKGITLANNNLGMMYESGVGVEKNLKLAAENYLVAAKDGNPNAQAAIAAMMLDGRYYKRNDTVALQWIQKAVEKNHPRAEQLMGHMYEYGRAVPKDRAEAIAWYLKAADHGDKWSAERLKELQK